jgi:hypothetical protein
VDTDRADALTGAWLSLTAAIARLAGSLRLGRTFDPGGDGRRP